MFRTVLILPAVASLLAISSVNAAADDTLKAPKITDSKLGTIRYGAESIVHWVQKMNADDTKRASTLKNDLAKLRARFQRVNGADAAQAKLISDYLDTIEKAIVTKSKSTTEPVGTPTERSIAKSPTNSAGSQKLAGDKAPLSATSPEMTDDDVSTFIASIPNKYGNKGSHALPEIRYLLRDQKLDASEIDAVTRQWTKHNEAVKRDLPKLEQIVAATGQGSYWLKWIREGNQKAYQQEITVFKSGIDSLVMRALQDAKNRSELDIEKHNFQFRGDAALKTLERFEAALEMIDQVTHLETLLDLNGEWSGKKADLQKYVSIYRDRVNEVDSGKSTSLPKEISNPELQKVAEEVLKVKKYGVGKWKRLIVNSKLMPRERIEHKAFNGSIETIVRQWEEFQVTTVEQDKNGKYYLYYNMIAKFSRAPRTTPIDEWILTKRFKGNAIAAENLK